MERLILIAIVLVIYIVYMGIKHKETWSKLAVIQNIGVLFTFIAVVSGGGIALYYGSRFITDSASNEIFSFIIQFIFAVVILFICMLVFNSAVSKITNGILPKKPERKR